MLIEYEGEDSGIGLLFASKAMIQIFINPISGTVIDRIGKYLHFDSVYSIQIMLSECSNNLIRRIDSG